MTETVVPQAETLLDNGVGIRGVVGHKTNKGNIGAKDGNTRANAFPNLQAALSDVNL